jgi:hypothetical protein
MNQTGGYDFFNFNKYRTDDLIVGSSEYDANNFRDWQNLNDNTDHNIRKLGIKQQYAFNLSTDYVSLDEINYLKALWASKKGYLSIDGIIIPVNIKDAAREINRKDKSKLFQYSVKFEYALR